MELPFDLSLSLKSLPVARIDREALKWMNLRTNPGVQKAIDEMGRLSAKTRNLKRPVTTFDKFADSEDQQSIYLLWKRNDKNLNKSIVMGYLKTCKRRLYLSDSIGKNYVVTPVSVLDFFIHPELQRQGFGEVLFNNMLNYEKIEKVEEQCAFDHPSAILLQFLEKKFQLINPAWQPTNMVVFPEFFNVHESVNNGSSLPVRSCENGSLSSEKCAKSSYDGTPSSTSTLQSARDQQRDSVGDLIQFRDRQLSARERVLSDTSHGRKHFHNLGHTSIW